MNEDGVYLLVMKDADYGVPYTLKNQTNPDGSTFVLLAGVDGVKILSNLEPGYRLIRLVPEREMPVNDPAYDMSKEQMLQFAARRRQVLTEAGCSTYRIAYLRLRDGASFAQGAPSVDREPRSILCLCCGRQSFNENDIVNHYCGFCHEYHSEWIDFDFMEQG